MSRRWMVVVVSLATVAGCDLLVPRQHACVGGNCSKQGAVDAGGNGDAHTDAGWVFVEPDAGSTLKVVTWNVLWFGSTDSRFGLEDDDLQQLNIRRVVGRLGADIYGLQEVVDPARLQAVAEGLEGYAGFTASDAVVGGGAASYYAGEAKPAFLYRTSTVEVLSASVISALDTYDFAGRPPLKVETRITKAGSTRELTVLVVHLKASGSRSDWQRRANSSVALKAWLDTNRPTSEVLVIGDFNDDLVRSYVAGSSGPLPSPFENFLADPGGYRFATQVLSDESLQTTVRYPTPIDHQLISNELEYSLLPDSVQVVHPQQEGWIEAYPFTTSDHYPVMAHYLMTVASSGSVQLTAPNGDEALQGGRTAQVEWSSTGMDRVWIDFSHDDGAHWRNLGTAAADAGVWTFTVPNLEAPQARVRISDPENPVDFDVSDAPFSVTRTTPSVFINELRYDEPGEDYALEFVELVNEGSAPWDLSRWTLWDSENVRATLPAGTVLAPGKALVIFGSVSAASLSGEPNAIGTSGLNLHPSDAFVLKDEFGVVVDSHTWTLSPGDGISVNRDPDGASGGPLVSHQTLAGTPSSPGRRTDGTSF